MSVMEGTIGDVRGVIAFSPDSTLIAAPARRRAGASDIGVWSAITGGAKTLSLGYDGMPSARAVIFSPDGRRLATQSVGYTVSLWDATTGLALHVLAVDRGLVPPVSSGGKNPGHAVVAWRSSDPPLPPEEPRRPQTEADVDPSDVVPHVSFTIPTDLHSYPPTFISPGTAKASNLPRTELPSLPSTASATREDLNASTTTMSKSSFRTSIYQIAFSPDNIHLAAIGPDGSSYLWDTDVGQLKLILAVDGVSTVTTSVAFSNSGSMIACGYTDARVRMWLIDGGKLVDEIETNEKSAVTQIVFLPGDHQMVLSLGSTVLTWDFGTKSLKENLRMQDLEGEIVISPGGERAACWTNGRQDPDIEVVDMAPGTSVTLGTLPHPGRVAALGFSPDGVHLATVSEDRVLLLCDIDSIRQFSHSSSNARASVLGFNGKHVVVGLPDGKRVVWDTSRGAAVAETMEAQTDCGWGFIANGTQLVTYRRAGPARGGAWNVEERSPDEGTGPSHPTSPPLPLAQESGVVAGRSEFEVRVWDVTSLNLWRTLPVDADPVALVASKSNTLVALVGRGDGEGIHILDTASRIVRRTCRFSFDPHSITMTFTPDGTYLIVCSALEGESSSHLVVCNIDTTNYSTGLVMANSCRRGYHCERLLVLAGGEIVQKGDRETTQYHGGMLLPLNTWEHRPNGLINIRSDERPTFLEIQGQWLYAFDSTSRWRLCWLPPAWRAILREQTFAAWEDSFLVLGDRNGAVIALNIDSLGSRADGQPRTPEEQDASLSASRRMRFPHHNGGGNYVHERPSGRCCVIS